MALSGDSFMPRFTFDNKITLGNVLTIISLVLAGVAAWYGLKQDVLAAGKDIAVLQSQIQPVEQLTVRLAVVERNQVIGKEAREQGQARTDAALKEQSAILSQILQSQAAILARLDERDRTPGK